MSFVLLKSSLSSGEDISERWCPGTMVQRGTCQHSQLQDSTSHWPTYSMDWGLVCHCQQGQILHNTISPKKQASPIKIGTHTLKEEDEATYLVVTFNKRLPWKPYTLRTEGKARKLALMRKLAGTTWGANEQILKTVRLVLEYNSTAWSTTANTNQQSLDKI